MAATAIYSVKPIRKNMLQGTETRKWQKSGVRRKKQLPEALKTQAFFVGVGKGQGVLYLFFRKWG